MDESTTSSNEAILHELVLRLSTYPGDPRVNDPRLLVGQVPIELSATLPLPEGSRVLGALIRSEEHVDIVVDSNLSPEAVLNFYRERMHAAGWSEPEPAMMPHHGGFVHSGFPGFENQAVFCKDSQGQALTVNAFEGRGGLTDVRLELSTGEYSPCTHQTRRQSRMMHMGLHDLIPSLVPPPGAHQLPGGGGSSSSDSYYSTATLETDIDLATLSAHYATQLEKAGWVRSSEGLNGPFAWHTWMFQDEENEPWRGLFFVLKTPGLEREHLLNVRVDWANKGEGDLRVVGGSFSFG
ncbi:MAG TPA: hypothetical protein VFZ02_00705 [Ktedonobacteraceae bacterium]